MADETKEKLSEEKTEEEKEPAKSASRVILDYVVWIGAVVLISFLLIHFVAQRTSVNGTSMVPSSSGSSAFRGRRSISIPTAISTSTDRFSKNTTDSRESSMRDLPRRRFILERMSTL